MKVIYNAVRPELISFINFEIDELLKETVWSCGKSLWNKDLTLGIFGTCLTASCRLITTQKIKKELSSNLPHDNYTTNYHVWEEMSGINFHNDEKYSFGATLYLNDWDMNWGGLFIWVDVNKNLHAVCPQKGMLVINDQKENHMVTSVSPLAPYARRSLQMFGA